MATLRSAFQKLFGTPDLPQSMIRTNQQPRTTRRLRCRWSRRWTRPSSTRRTVYARPAAPAVMVLHREWSGRAAADYLGPSHVTIGGGHF